MTKKIKKRVIFLIMTFPLFVFLVLTILVPLIRYKLHSSNDKFSKNINIVAHRGAAGFAPENTLSSFKKAISLGVDFIELDVHLSKDNELIVMHDSDVKRTTNGSGEINEMLLSEIKKLDAGSWFDEKYKNEKVPVLSDVLELVDGKTKILIEIKWPKKGIYKDLVEKLIEQLEIYNAYEFVIVQSFEDKYLSEISSKNKKIICHKLIFGQSTFLPFYYDRGFKFGYYTPKEYISSVNRFYYYSSPKLISKLNSTNISTGVFTVNKKEDMLKVASMGAVYIITDYPNIAMSTFKNR